jgi:hypothetical protein
MTEKVSADDILFDECVYLCQNNLAPSIQAASTLSTPRRRRLIERSLHLKSLERRELINAIIGCFGRQE